MNSLWLFSSSRIKAASPKVKLPFFHVRSAAAELAGVVSKPIKWLITLGCGNDPWGLVANAQWWWVHLPTEEGPSEPWSTMDRHSREWGLRIPAVPGRNSSVPLRPQFWGKRLQLKHPFLSMGSKSPGSGREWNMEITCMADSRQ